MLSGSELLFTGPYALQGMLIGYPYLCLSSLLHFTASKGKHSKLLASSTEPLPFLISHVGPSTLELSAPISQLPCHFSWKMSKRLFSPCMVVLTQLSLCNWLESLSPAANIWRQELREKQHNKAHKPIKPHLVICHASLHPVQHRPCFPPQSEGCSVSCMHSLCKPGASPHTCQQIPQ